MLSYTESEVPQLEISIAAMTLAQSQDPEQSSAQQPPIQPSECRKNRSPSGIDYTLKVDPSKPIRRYQKELAEPGINGENYIVCAPTGTGKTLVAGLIISHHLQKRQNLEKKVVFVVPTRPLAEQQAKELQRLIPGAQVECSIGDDVGLTIKDVLPHSDIIVCTPGKLVNEIKLNLFTFYNLGLMVLDECHHTRKSDPYAKLMEKYLEDKKKSGAKGLPQVVGLTASPGAGENPNLEMDKTIDHLISLCALMDATSGIKVVAENVTELDQHTSKPTQTLKIHNRRDPEEEFIRCITHEMTMLENLVCFKSHFKKWAQEYEACVQQEKLLLKRSPDPDYRSSIRIYDLLRCYSQALNVYMDLRQKDAISVLGEFTGLPTDVQANDIEKQLKRGLEKLICKLTLLPPVQNPLLQQVEAILQEHFTKNPDSMGILFVHTRKHASSMCDWLSTVAGLQIQPRMITGHTRDTGHGMTQVEQEEVMESFRNGECNVLVATSVAEEGLDVPACNLVIRFQHVSNEIARTQTQGRARAARSEGYTILASGSKKPLREMKNIELQTLVDEVLLDYFPTGRFLQEKLRESQQKILQVCESKRKLQQQQQKINSRRDIELKCNVCKTVACSGSNIFSVENSTQYIVPDEEFKHKIVKKPHPSPKQLTQKMNKTHKIHCAKCDADWGNMCIWSKGGHEFPVLKCKSFIFEIRGVTRSIKKWSDAPFKILPLFTNSDSEPE